ncbi:PREDICTED: protein BIG GRAIN 1-like B [Tarenaya hassleriana]|uniref:protein BIG GRAIN 1-like B n=1 Tax=Tarenaya hassleriana TaxID=28532 RepID=UPI00053C1624|nr:PREDICTED: protein BIG GRAIN 1-like B [Tarenaya hassleriana]
MLRTNRENERKCKKTDNSQNPSFSSFLLDQIYRSIDSEDSRCYRSCPVREQSKTYKKTQDFEDSTFFSSGSCSSDTSSSGFSASDTELIYGNRTAKPFCVAPPRPRPVRVAEKTEKREEKQRILFHGNRDRVKQEENDLIKSESRAMKIYNNLKKLKQPISPGGRIASFINSLFTGTNNVKKPEICRNPDDGFIRKSQTSIKHFSSSSSSSCSQSRSCLSKYSTSTREKQKNTEKRSVRFYPVSVIVGDDSIPCGHKSIGEEEKGLKKVSGFATNEKRISEYAAAREEEIRVMVAEKSKRVEMIAREILREYERNKKRKESYGRCEGEEEDDENDDVLSCSSSDLFELDLVGNGRYRDELPVYETTHLQTNHAIASGLIL